MGVATFLLIFRFLCMTETAGFIFSLISLSSSAHGSSDNTASSLSATPSFSIVSTLSSSAKIAPSSAAARLLPDTPSSSSYSPMCDSNSPRLNSDDIARTTTIIVIAMAALVFLLLTANVLVFVMCLVNRRKKKKQSATEIESINFSNTVPSAHHLAETKRNSELQSPSAISTVSNMAYLANSIQLSDNPSYQPRQRATKTRTRSLSLTYAYVDPRF